MYTVNVTFEGKNVQPVVLKNVEDGQTLLELLLANNIKIDHECGGICTCTTCHVYVKKGMSFIEDKSRRENDFIRKKIPGSLETSRLSCQALIMKGNGVIEITIPNDTSEIVKPKSNIE